MELAKMPCKRVVVGLRDRVELVVVAAGAGDGQPEEGFGCHVSIRSLMISVGLPL